MAGPQYVVVLITVGNEAEAQRIADGLLGSRKAACVNIVKSVQSCFWWQGKLDSATECLLLVKTRARLVEQVVKLVRQLHSYDVPEIIALPIVGGHDGYLKWIEEETEL